MSQDIQFCKACTTDPVGRVFFYQGRVFRAIYPKYESRVLILLQSELYRKLLENSLIVKTWVTKDITIDGYSLIVEHEKLFVSRPQDWSFEIQKEVAIATLRLEKICNKYGYTMNDAMAGNFVIKKGLPVLIDIGAIEEGERNEHFDKMFANWQYYLLSLYVHQDAPWVDLNMHGQGKVYPTKFPQRSTFAPYKFQIFKEAIDYYCVYYHIDSWRVKVHSSIWLQLAQNINNMVRRLIPKVGCRELIKCGQIHYKRFETDDIIRIQSPYQQDLSFFEIDTSVDILVALSAKRIQFTGNIVTCIGNFKYEDLEKLYNTTNNSVHVITHDMCYADTLYKHVRKNRIDINVLCMDPVNSTVENKEWIQNYNGDIVIIQHFWEIFTTHSKAGLPAYHVESVVEMLASITKRYVIVPVICPEFMRFFEMYFVQIASFIKDKIAFDVYELREHQMI